MNSIERTLRALEHKTPDRVPVDLHNFLVTARMMGATTSMTHWKGRGR